MQRRENSHSVFHDPHRRRWKLVSTVGLLFGLALSVVLAVTIVSVLVSPVLPTLGLKSIAGLPQAQHLALDPAALSAHRHHHHSGEMLRAKPGKVGQPRTRPQRFAVPSALARQAHARYRLQLAHARAGRGPPSDQETTQAPAARPVPGAAPMASDSTSAPGPGAHGYHPMLIGFYVNWDDASLLSLKEHLGAFDVVVPEWLHVAGASGEVSPDDPVQEQITLDLIRRTRPGLPVVPLVNNYDQTNQVWDSANLAKNLHAPAQRQAIAQRLLQYVQSQHLSGICIDFEDLQPSSREDLVVFMQTASALFHNAGLRICEAVPADDPAFDYARLSAASDFLAVMVYDQHAGSSDAGPVAAQDWFSSILAKRSRDIPANKLVLGLGSYGYDWVKGQPTQPVTFEQALATARVYGVQPSMDASSFNLHYDYTDHSGASHHVWLLDAASAFDEIAAARTSMPAGYALWRLGSEDPSIWPVFANREQLSGRVARSLSVIDLSQDVAYQGSGEILRVTGTPVRGRRAVTVDPSTGLISGEKIARWAMPYMVTRWGGSAAKKVALTFDDGPDPQWTPQILDVLDTNDVPATFFVIGVNADAEPAILKRELAIGEEIGNHTFTHPDIAAISPHEVKWQLDAVQRLFESVLGVRSVLFRPPYGEDAEPDTPQQVAPLMETGKLGYYTVGMNVDPSDWAQPGVAEIVDRTVAQVESKRGHIVLLHDGGGDRSQTVAALPGIIKRLRQDGYQFVTVSDLVGIPRSIVMPTVPPQDRFFATMDKASFDLMDWIRVWLYWVFMLGIVLGIARLVLVGALAVFERIREHSVARQSSPTDFEPTVSVIVPAYNEAPVIVSSVRALLASDYSNLHVVVVDDGSTDDTFDVAQAAFPDEPRVTVLSKPNAGKADALNFGIAGTDGEIIIGMDADTLFRPDAVSKLVRHFSDPKVAAVAGNAKVGNRMNLLTRWQALEYITNQNLDRRAFDVLNCITVVPGAIGAWRRELVLEVGGFSPDTLAEDADLTFRVTRHGARVVYEDEAIAFTEAPDTIGGLARQRSRWVFGTMQTLWKHRDLLGRPSSGALGMVGMPNAILFQILFQLVSPVMDLAMVLSISNVFAQREQHPLDWSPAGFEHILFYYALFLALDLGASALAFALEPHGEDWSLLVWLFLQRFFYRQLMYVVVWGAVVNAVRGTILGWQKVERKATVDTA